MKIKYVLHNMHPLLREAMDGDLKCYVYQKRYDMLQTVLRLQSNKGMLNRILKVIQKNAKVAMTIATLEMHLDTAKDKSITSYSVKKGEGKDVILEMSMDDSYFIVDGMVKKMMPRFHRKSFDGTDISKNDWVKFVEKNISVWHKSKDWTKEILEP